MYRDLVANPIGIADAMSSTCVDLPVLFLTASTRGFQQCRGACKIDFCGMSVHMSVHICTHVRTHVCTHVYTDVCMQVCTLVCTHVYTHVHSHVCTHVYTHVYTQPLISCTGLCALSAVDCCFGMCLQAIWTGSVACLPMWTGSAACLPMWTGSMHRSIRI